MRVEVQVDPAVSLAKYLFNLIMHVGVSLHNLNSPVWVAVKPNASAEQLSDRKTDMDQFERGGTIPSVA